VTSSLEDAILVKINAYDKIMIENPKKANMQIKELLHNSPPKESFANEIRSLLERADARDSANIIHLICDA